MRKLKFIVIVLAVLFSIQTKAQDFPYHYFMHIYPGINNPARIAADSKVEAAVSVHTLWAGGFKPLNDYFAGFSFSPDFRKRRSRYSYQPRIGLGGVLLRDQLGPFSRNTFQLIYSYHIPLSGDALLSLGVSATAETLQIDVNSLNPLVENDPRLLTGNNSSVIMDGGFGASLKSEDFRISFSVLNLAPADFNFKNNTVAAVENYRKYFFCGEYQVRLSSSFLLQPAFTIRNTFHQKLGYDCRIKFDLDLLHLGGGYRSEKNVFVFAEVPLDGFAFSWTSENPVMSNHMVGKGHTFSLRWNFNAPDN